MPSLREDFRFLKESLSQAASVVTDFQLDDSCVKFKVPFVPGNVSCSVSIVFTDPESYPHSGALVLAEADVSAEFDKLNERFSDSATLHEVVQQVLVATGHRTTLSRATENCSTKDEDMTNAHSGSEAGADDESMQHSDSEDYENGSDGGDEEEEGEDDYDRDMMIEIGTKQSLWERIEQQKDQPLDSNSQKSEELSAIQNAVAERQIFNTREAFQMLTRELSDIIRAQDPARFADAVDGNVYCWDVHLGGFASNSLLAQDLSQCQKQHGFSMVQLRITFMRGLHPFYPPAVEIVRPHFVGPTLGVLAAHPMLQLANWDPWKAQTAVLEELKLFLQDNARVELGHPGNRCEGAAYSLVEHMVARLESTSQLPALRDPNHLPLYQACDAFHGDEARKEALLQSNKRSRCAPDAPDASKQSFWKAGTGYGHGKADGPVWDAKAAEAAQRAQDHQRQLVLRQLAAALALELGGTVGPLPTSYGQPLEQLVPVSSTIPLGEQVTASILYALRYSSLLPYATTELRSASVTDMTQRAEYYCSLLEVLRQMARPATAHLLRMAVEGSSVAACVQGMLQSAAQFKKMTLSHRRQRQETSEAKAQQLVLPAPSSQASTSAAGSAGPTAAQKMLQNQLSLMQQQEEAADRRELEGLLVAELLLDIASRLASIAHTDPDPDPAAAGPSSDSRQQAGASTSGAGGAGASSSASYMDALRPLQVQYLPRFSSGHVSAGQSEASGGTRARMTRVLRESTGLDRLLPLSESSSIFVAVNEAQATLWKALIVGPDDTPYSGGCFLFDIYFPPQYPQAPPLVSFKTTGGGTIRFNPNLYAEGKVCLSLLGTWSGGKGEGWNASASTALQVLISIQSLILVEQPYFNEPGYEKTINTPAGNLANRDYNKVIREGTIKWAMVEYLRTPPPEFAEVIKLHFRLRGAGICRMVEGWVREAATYDKEHSRRMEALLQQLQQLIAKL